MRKILKFIKHNVFGFIAGAVIFGSLGVYAASVISASNVGYTDNNDLEAVNVQDAIDKLNTKATTKISEAKEECPDGNLCVFAKPGDYVKMTPTSTSYTVTTAMTGYTSNQTINPSELNLWRVININSDGTLDLISEYVSSTNVCFRGKIGFQNLVSSLNQIAAQYTNSKYTVSSRYVGYSEQTSIITDTSKLDSTTAPWTYNTSSSKITEDESKGGGDIEYVSDYNLVKKILGTAKANKVGTTEAKEYILASRGYGYNATTGWVFHSRYVKTNGDLYYRHLYDGNVSGKFSVDSSNEGIRPLITIKSGLSPKGLGTSSSPYVLE